METYPDECEIPWDLMKMETYPDECDIPWEIHEHAEEIMYFLLRYSEKSS